MSRLINKLNVLVQSSLHGVLGESSSPRRKEISTRQLGKGIDKEIAALREQIDGALDAEDRTVAELDTMQREIAALDQQVDSALTQGDDATARHLASQLQVKQQQHTMLAADLAQHRRSTSELIKRVNELEAVVAEARRREAAADDEQVEHADDSLSSRLRKVREMVTGEQAEPTAVADAPATPTDVIDEQAVNDDLARRRDRLSQ
ncbi:MAG: hypothetical protein K8S97_11985 [Anaerolineae bacterium]|nr:hypothetical protein [Anaerolineae bacterium]